MIFKLRQNIKPKNQFKQKKIEFFNTKLTENIDKPKELWKIMAVS